MGDLRPTMENMADPILLEKIDKLFASGVGEHIALPQIVVVGDQSSGKVPFLKDLPAYHFLETVVFALALQLRSPFVEPWQRPSPCQ